MENQKIINLLNNSNNQPSNFTVKMVCQSTIYQSENKIKLETETIRPRLCFCSDAYILVTGDISVTVDGAVLSVAFKTYASFIRYITT